MNELTPANKKAMLSIIAFLFFFSSLILPLAPRVGNSLIDAFLMQGSALIFMLIILGNYYKYELLDFLSLRHFPTLKEVLQVILWTFLVAMLGGLCMQILVYLGVEEIKSPPLVAILKESSTIAIVLGALAICILAPITEEIAFRLCLYHGLSHLYPQKMAIFFTSLLFALIHLQKLQFIPLFMLGFLFQWLFLWRRNLWLAIIGHAFINTLSTTVALLLKGVTP